MSPWRFLLVAVVALSGATPAAAREVHGVTLEEFRAIEDWGLPMKLAGAAVVERHFLPIYVAALYVGKDPPTRERIAEGMAPVRLELHWLGGAMDAEAVSAYWMAQFERGLADPSRAPVLRPALLRVARALGPVQRGDLVVLEYHPDQGLRVQKGSEPAKRFPGLETNRLVLAAWFGPRADGEAVSALMGTAAQQKPPGG